MTRLILFDIDGTLIRTGGAGVESFARTADLLFGKPDGTRDIEFHGRTDTGIVREFLQRHHIPVTPDNVGRFLDAYVFLLHHRMSRNPGEILPGVLEAIDTLRGLDSQPTLGLLTGNIRLGAEIKLRAHNLWSPFLTGAFGDDHEDRNQIARVAHQRAQSVLPHPVAPHETLVIGDTPRDIECARAIGARCLAVATGGCRIDSLRQHQPDWAVESLAEVPWNTVTA